MDNTKHELDKILNPIRTAQKIIKTQSPIDYMSNSKLICRDDMLRCAIESTLRLADILQNTRQNTPK